MHHFRPFYDHPADPRSQIMAGRPPCMTAISTSGHPALRRTRTASPLDAKRCKWHVVGVQCAVSIGTNEIWHAIWLSWLGAMSFRTAHSSLPRSSRRSPRLPLRASSLLRAAVASAAAAAAQERGACSSSFVVSTLCVFGDDHV